MRRSKKLKRVGCDDLHLILVPADHVDAFTATMFTLCSYNSNGNGNQPGTCSNGRGVSCCPTMARLCT